MASKPSQSADRPGSHRLLMILIDCLMVRERIPTRSLLESKQERANSTTINDATAARESRSHESAFIPSSRSEFSVCTVFFSQYSKERCSTEMHSKKGLLSAFWCRIFVPLFSRKKWFLSITLVPMTKTKSRKHDRLSK